MAITRRMVAQEDNFWIKVDHRTRFVENDSPEWQFIFGPNSSLNTNNQIIKIAAKFDDDSFSAIKFTAYLYDANNASVASGASCNFRIFKVTSPDWTEVEIANFSGAYLSNNHYYSAQDLSSLSLNFLGGDTIMVEASIVRLGITYRDRIYVNHLGIYDNVSRLRQDVEFLEITKEDI